MTAASTQNQQKNRGILQHLATTGPLRAVTAGKMKKFLSGAFILATITIAALVLWTVVYNHRERLSDRQLIARAVADAVKSPHGPIKYSSADELMRLNPGCCIVRHSGHEWLRFPARLYEDGLSVVQMSYMIGGISQAYYLEEFAIDADGKIPETTGIEENTPSRW